MNIKRWTLTFVAALALLAMSTQPALAQGNWVPWEATFKLEPTLYGDQCSASGWTHIGVKGDREFLEVQVFAKIADHTSLTVWGQNNLRTWFEVGKIELLLGSGRLEILQDPTLDTQQVFPLSQLKRLEVYQARQAMLKTSFAALPGN